MHFCFCLAGTFDHEDELRHAAGHEHPRLRYELKTEFERMPEAELLEEIKEEFDRQLHAVVVVGFKAVRLKRHDFFDKFADMLKAGQEYR